jgi:mannose-6-phosphate isomerase-like protein (cupin superfamily)
MTLNKSINEVKMEEFLSVPYHTNFKAKRLFTNGGRINDCLLAIIGPNGGGPEHNHTHDHDHIFIVTKGQAKIIYGDETIILNEYESCSVKGDVPHSIWNNVDSETIMIGISIK